MDALAGSDQHHPREPMRLLRSPTLIGAIYLLLIPIFAAIYSGPLDGQFYHSTIAHELDFGNDARNELIPRLEQEIRNNVHNVFTVLTYRMIVGTSTSIRSTSGHSDSTGTRFPQRRP